MGRKVVDGMSEAQRPGTQKNAALPQPAAPPATGGVPAAPPPPLRDPHRSSLGRFFAVVVRPQSWLNLLYLGLAFPLGLFYFVFLTVCLSVGISLVIIWVGIFILGLTAACWWAFAAFERSLADGLLGTRLVPSPQPWRRVEGTWPRIRAHFSSSATWKDLAFLFVKFPLGVLSFCVVVVLVSTSLGFVGAPFYYRYATSSGAHGVVHHGLYFGVGTVDRLWEALLLVPLGLLLAVLSFHAFNGLAAMWRAVARGLLTRDTAPRPAPAAASAGPAFPPTLPSAQPAAPPQEPRAQLAAAWPAYPGCPTQPGVTPSASGSPAPPSAPVVPPPYGWLYYPQTPYWSQPAPPPASQPGEDQPGAVQPGAVQPGAPWPGAPWSGAPWSGAPWSGAPWAQWPPMFGPTQASPPAAAAGGHDATPSEIPDAAAPNAAVASSEATAPEAITPKTATDGQPPSQEEQT
jgi:hypothetical protein